MASVVFVHGTGVRQPAFYETVQTIEARLAQVAADAVVVQCYWAEQFGARLQCDGRSIPSYDQTKAIGVAVGDEIALWTLLLDDPLAELNALAAKSAGPEKLAPGKQPYAARLPPALLTLPSVPAVVAAAGACAPAQYFTNACTSLAAESALFAAAVPAAVAIARVGEGGYDAAREVVARAVVAGTLGPATAAGWPACDAGVRDELVLQVFLALGGTAAEAKGMWGDALRAAIAPVVSAGARLATWRMRSRRGAVTDAVSPMSGDILVYLANGGPIRQFIRQTIESAKPPVHVVAHSLGGIACVDLCVLDPPKTLETLVTVGSQAPYLYEIGALPSLRPPAPLPQTFPNWINVHDPNDMLSYVGNGIFPGRVEDIEVRSGLPFPYSHSAYWTSAVLWAALAKRLA